MELAHLPYRKGKTYEEYVGERGLERFGRKRWRRRGSPSGEGAGERRARARYVVLGGGNAKFRDAARGARLGDNANAFEGGFLLWKDAERAQTRGKKMPQGRASCRPDPRSARPRAPSSRSDARRPDPRRSRRGNTRRTGADRARPDRSGSVGSRRAPDAGPSVEQKQTQETALELRGDLTRFAFLPDPVGSSTVKSSPKKS